MKKGNDLFSLFYKNSLAVETIIVCIIFQLLTSGMFLTSRNISNLLMQASTCSIIAITMCLVIITCNADLSAGRMLGMLGMIAALMQVHTKLPSGVVILIVYAITMVFGVAHGFLIGYLRLPAFIITLTTQLLFLGINQLISGGVIVGPAQGLVAAMGNGYIPHLSGTNDTTLILGIIVIALYVFFTVNGEKRNIKQGLIEPRWNQIIPKLAVLSAIILVFTIILFMNNGFSWAMLILFGMAILVSYVSQNTKFGRYVFAMGGNMNAAALSGINVKKETMKLYLLHAFMVGTAALVYLGRVGSATTAAGNGYEFTAITGCVVGGTSITGGRGSVFGAVIGTIFMAAIDNGMSLMNVDASMQYIVRGIVLLFAIILDQYANTRKARTVVAA
jgi:D-xylose transport system permease protein